MENLRTKPFQDFSEFSDFLKSFCLATHSFMFDGNRAFPLFPQSVALIDFLWLEVLVVGPFSVEVM